jgi:GAF domain-containing protein
VVIRSLEDHLPVDFSCVGEYDPSGNGLTITSVGLRSAALARELALTEHARIAIDENGLAQCMRGQLVYEPDISHAEFSFTQRLVRAGLRALVAVPLLVESTVYGLLVAAHRQPHTCKSLLAGAYDALPIVKGIVYASPAV